MGKKETNVVGPEIFRSVNLSESRLKYAYLPGVEPGLFGDLHIRTLKY